MLKRVAAAAIAIAVIVVGLPTAAYAAPPVAAAPTLAAAEPEGTPINVLAECKEPGERGGWALRDFMASGTNSTAAADVRPRQLRLGEPCVDAGAIVIPGKITEVPISSFEDEECTSINGYVFCGEQNQDVIGCLPGTNPSATLVWQEIRDTAVNSNCVAPAWLGAGGSQYTATDTYPAHATVGTGATVTTDWSGMETSGTQRGMIFSLWCWVGGQPNTVLQDDSEQLSFTGTIPAATTPLMTCTGTRVPYAVVTTSRISSVEGGATGRRFGIIWKADGSVFMPTIGGYQSSVMTVGKNDPLTTAMTGYIECRDTRTSESETQDQQALYEFGAETDAPYEWTVPYQSDEIPTTVEWSRTVRMNLGAGGDSLWRSAACPVLVRVVIVVCTYHDNGSSLPGCTQTRWESQAYQQNHDYGDGDGLEQLCGVQGFETPDCQEILYPPYVDPTAFEDVCGDPPGISFTELLVFPYYMDCLFNPKGGWDRDGIVAERWEASAGDDLASVVGEVGGSIAFYESCGVILSTNIGGAPFQLDSCAWSAWAPMHTLLTWALWVLFGLWALGFVMKTVTGVVTKKTPTPLEES